MNQSFDKMFKNVYCTLHLSLSLMQTVNISTIFSAENQQNELSLSIKFFLSLNGSSYTVYLKKGVLNGCSAFWFLCFCVHSKFCEHIVLQTWVKPQPKPQS